MKLSIIIVNYNTYALTKQTIDSVLEQKCGFNYEVILVDNGSTDGSVEALEEDFKDDTRIHIIKNIQNLGFAKGNNMGIKRSRGEYILLLNSDTQVKEDCLKLCLTQMEADTRLGALGCKVVLPDGKLDHACKRGFPTPKASLYYFLKLDKRNPEKFGQYDALNLDEDEVGEVDTLMGAFMLMPRKVLNEVGFLDENFFMYGEDIDLCFRIKEAGYKVLYFPKAQITHYKGGSSKKHRNKVIYDFHQAMWLFYKKHYEKEYNWGVKCLVMIGIGGKCVLELIKNAFKPKNEITTTYSNHNTMNQ